MLPSVNQCKTVVVGLALASGLTGCAKEAVGNEASPTTVSSPVSTSTSRPSPIGPDGFAAKPPTSEQVAKYQVWLNDSSHIIKDAVTAMEGLTASNQLVSVVNACQNLTGILSIRLQAALPAPDPDLTNALTNVIQDGRDLEVTCEALHKTNGSAGALAATNTVHDQLVNDIKIAGNIITRNEDLIAKR